MTREDELIKKLKNGEQEALDELIGLYYPAIRRYCLWHMPDRESAEDAVRETFLKMVRTLDRYEHHGRFKAFLYRIAANTCIDMLRREHRMEQLPEDAFFHEPGFEAAEDRLRLGAAFRKLEKWQRELATAFSAGKMILAQFLFIGTGDICMLAVLFLMARHYRTPGSLVFISLVIPFLTSAAACMMLWARTDPVTFVRLGTVICMLPFPGILWLTGKHAEVFTVSCLPVWICYAAVCTAVILWQSGRLAGRENYERVYP